MQIILLRDIKGLGRVGDIVSVSDGYGRNFLIKQGFGKLADKTAVHHLARNRELKDKQEQSARENAEKAAGKLAGQVFEFELAADENGHLYAGLKESEIIAKIRNREPRLPERAKLVDYLPIKSTGDHEVRLHIHENKTVSVRILVRVKSV